MSSIAGTRAEQQSGEFASADAVRRIVYTTNAIEALNAKLRRAVRAKSRFRNDKSAMKLFFLALHRSEKDWRMRPEVGHGQGAVRNPVQSALYQSAVLISETSSRHTRNS